MSYQIVGTDDDKAGLFATGKEARGPCTSAYRVNILVSTPAQQRSWKDVEPLTEGCMFFYTSCFVLDRGGPL